MIPIGTVLANDLLPGTEYRIISHKPGPGNTKVSYADTYLNGVKTYPDQPFYSGTLEALIALKAGWKVLSQVIQRPTASGLKCGRCQEFYPYAEPNQPDGSLKCWSCRQ